MMSSGPLEPSDLPIYTAYPTPIIVPLDHVETQVKMNKSPIEVDETGLYMMSKAVEEFIHQLLREVSQNGTQEFNYDTMAKYIQSSEFKSLREFFPERVRYGDIIHVLFPERATPTTSPSTSNS